MIVVTGASGFLGKALLKELSDLGIAATAVSRSAIKDNVLPNIRYLCVQSYTETPCGDILVHLAENPNIQSVNQLGKDYMDSACNLIDCFVKKKFSHIIYASSAAVYKSKPGELIEVTDPVRTDVLYTKTKLRCENAILSNNGLVLRFSNLYGHGMSQKNVISDIFSQLNNEEPVLIRDGTPIRDFLWHSDAAKAIVASIQHHLRGLFNVGSSEKTAINSLAKTILKLAHMEEKGIQIVNQNQVYPSSEIVLDISKTIAACRWKPKIHLQSGLKQLLNFKFTGVHE